MMGHSFINVDYTNTILEQQTRIKTAWLDMLHDSYKS